MSNVELTTTDYYLRDLLRLLIERAREARAERGELNTGGGYSFEAGKAAAYYEAVATAIGNLKSFGLPLERFDLSADFDPDRELL